MKKLFKYIKKNIKAIIYIVLLSTAFLFLIFPHLFKINFLEHFLLEASRDGLIGITMLILFLLIFSWSKLRDYWKKYKNTYDLEDTSILTIDYIVLFIVFTVILIILFKKEYYYAFNKLSMDFKIFLLINSIFIVTWFLSSYYSKNKKQKKHLFNNDESVLLDEPIYFLEQDLLAREKFIKDLEKEITNFSFENSLTIGLNGSWGEGKTSIMNILKNILKDDERFFIVDFKPWNFKDEEAILSAFYYQIEQTFNTEYILPGFEKTIMKYKNMVFMGLSNTGVNINLTNSKESMDTVKNRIEQYIGQIGKKIIIFIDDIDRLQPNEVFLIFKLVRSCTNFKRIVFLLAFDPVIIQKYLKDNLNLESEFLEKIIQRPISLPQIEQISIDRFLDKHLEILFDELAISEEREKSFDESFLLIYNTQIRKIFYSLRRTKRFLNGIRFALPIIKNEVNLYDFLILEMIRNFYPKIYDDIWKNPWSYLPINWDVEYYFSSPFYSNFDENKKNEIVKKHIENIIEGEKDSEIITELLKTIFFEVKDVLEKYKTGQNYSRETYRAEKRITHPECFKKYFMLKVPSTDISDELIEATLNLFVEQKEEARESVISRTIFNMQKQKNLSKFFDKILIFTEKIPENVSLSLIRVLYKNSDSFSRKSPDVFYNSEYDKSIKTLMFIVNDNIKKDQIYYVLEEIIKNANLSYSVLAIYFCQRGGGGQLFSIYESINKENLNKLKEILTKRLEKYFVEEKRDIFEEIPEKDAGWIFVLYQWGSNWETFEGENNKIVNDYVLSLITENPKKFVAFLKSQKGTIFDKEIVYNLKEISRIYNIEDLYNIAEKFKNDPSLSTAEKKTIEIFIDVY